MSAAALTRLWSRVADAMRGWAPGGRGAWCRKQRHRLRSPGAQVVWVRGAADVQWAVWGARRGYFEVRYVGGLAYLRALTAHAG